MDFAEMAKGSSYVKARRALREAERDQKAAVHRRVESSLRERQKATEVETVVRLSTTTGGPSLNNVQQKLIQQRTKSPPPPPSRKNVERTDEARPDRSLERTKKDRDARTKFLVMQEKRVNDAFKGSVNRALLFLAFDFTNQQANNFIKVSNLWAWISTREKRKGGGGVSRCRIVTKVLSRTSATRSTKTEREEKEIANEAKETTCSWKKN